MPLRVHYLQHVAFEGPGRIGPWAEAAGAAVTATRFYENQALITNGFDDLRSGPYVQSPQAMQRADDLYGPNHAALDAILERLTAALHRRT